MSKAEMTQFELSRIYAKGWTAGRASELDSADGDFESAVDALNPYEIAEERERWATGFKDGLRRSGEIGGRRNRQTTFTAKAPPHKSGR